MKNFTRRQFAAAGLGASSVALNFLTARGQASAAPPRTAALDDGQPAVKLPHHQPTARSVIFLFMSGGPSQVDTFDPKPELSRLAGKDVPRSLASNVPQIKRAGLKNLMASPWKFKQHGESGLAVSSLFPQTARHADDLCVIRSMTHRNPVHGPGECVALTGTGAGDRPGLGAWAMYGLGSMNEQLPAFVAMHLHTDGMQHPQAAGWGAGFLPSRFQGVVVDPEKGVSNVKMPTGTTAGQRLKELELIQQFDQQFLEKTGPGSSIAARIASYRVAFSMQSAAPELFDIARETAATKKAYGLEQAATRSTARGCLLARRMVERGVRFVQLRVGGWDAHGNIKGNHERLAARTDQPVAALLADLKQRGLLESTLVVWGGEFGRTPTMEGLGKGRDHSPAGYSIWLAGGGVRGGQTIGQTDEIGYTVTSQPVRPQDLHATILHALGIHSGRLTFNHHGLQETPAGVTGGSVVGNVFA